MAAASDSTPNTSPSHRAKGPIATPDSRPPLRSPWSATERGEYRSGVPSVRLEPALESSRKASLMRMMAEAAELGHPTAQFMTGLAHLQGRDGVKRSVVDAFHFFSMAVNIFVISPF